MVFAILLLLSIAFRLHSLELQRVIVSSDSNPMYLEFWPLVAASWKKIVGLKPTLALIAGPEVVVDETCGDVIRFDPIPGVSTALHAQVIRLFLPALFPDDGCLISDMDMIPLSRSYFINSVTHCSDDSFVVYRDQAVLEEDRQYPMCYIAAKGKVYGDIFSVRSFDDITEKVKFSAAQKLDWFTDQLLLRFYADQWHLRTGRMVKLGHTVTRRVDRGYWSYVPELLKTGFYIDAHLLRPYQKNKAAINGLCWHLGLDQQCSGGTKNKSFKDLVKSYEHGKLTEKAPLGDFDIDGEGLVIEHCISDGAIVCDVGANCGDWSACVRKHSASAQIYACEPVPCAQEQFKRRFSKDSLCELVPCAITSATRELTFYDYPHDGSVLSSTYKRHRLENLFGMRCNEYKVLGLTLDALCEKYGISFVDFLKIDTEGAEFDVLSGAKNLLSQRKIKFIQFEYGATYIDSHFTLRQVARLLTDYGYTLFKIHPDSLIHLAYWHPAYEDYYQSNWLAVAPEYACGYAPCTF